MKKTILIKILLSAAAVTAIVLFLNASLLFPWQWEARKNKHAALEYVSDKFPEANFVKAYYRTTKINFGNPGHDQFVFELNGIRFPVFAEHGKVANDFCSEAFAEYQLYNTYIKPFVESRNIVAEFNYYTSDLQEFFKYNPESNISQFDGSVWIKIYDDKCNNPKSSGWLYEFYCYCRDNIPFTSYTVTMICLGGSLTYSSEQIFSNEDDFYNSFR
ncbi:MAG: hypothetical protein NC299_11480 [Lachnospiraceae bacterium]|nr:hypothetical protein [Ruminococcus sp.]MCM1275964.1 hypothetical protein [Lachnospiraceae bacterium]